MIEWFNNGLSNYYQHNKIDVTVTEQESVRHTVVYFTTGDGVGQEVKASRSKIPKKPVVDVILRICYNASVRQQRDNYEGDMPIVKNRSVLRN